MKLTEMEKTVLMAFYALSDGSTRKSVDKNEVIQKFARRQRKSVKRYIKKLEKKSLIKQGDDENKYKINKKAKEQATKIILKGGRLRI